METRGDIAFLTPSFFGDFEQCRLLNESLARFVKDDYHHYIVVDAADYSLFKVLDSSNTTVLTKEDVLPSWVTRFRFKVPRKNRYFRFSWKSLPIRGWIAQQMAKLQVCAQLKENTVIIVDSDVFVCRDFRLSDIMRDGKVPLYLKPNVITAENLPLYIEWFKTANSILGLPERELPGPDFISPFTCWRPEILQKARAQIEETCGQDWMVVIARHWNFCEPVIYGTYVEYQGPAECGHWVIDQPLSYSWWKQNVISDKELQEFLQNIPDYCYAVNIQSKAEFSIDTYKQLVTSFF